jgi:hypothetical protein
MELATQTVVLCGQTLAAFSAATVQDLAATLCSHARAKAVSALTFNDTGLKCSFHNGFPDVSVGRDIGAEAGICCGDKSDQKKVGYSM